MNSASPFLIIEKPAEEIIGRAIQQFESAGLQVLRTFDLQEARLSHPDCHCPAHGTENCDCQMSVLLVYKGGQPPASILIHSFRENTQLYLVDTPEQRVDQDLDQLIRKILAIPFLPVPSKTENDFHSGKESL